MTVPVPNYDGSGLPTSTSTGSSIDTDPFGLGDLGNQNLYTGTQYGSPGHTRGDDGDDGHTTRVVNDYTTTDEVIKRAAASSQESPQEYQQLQSALYQAGYFGSTKAASIRFGVWNAQTADAIKESFKTYLQISQGASVPLTYSEFLQNQTAALQNDNAAGGSSQGASTTSTSGSGGSGSGAAAPQVSLTDPDALKAYAQNAATNALGHQLSQTQLAHFVDSFHTQQLAAGTSTAASVTSPDPTAQAQSYAQTVDPTGFQGHQQQSFMSALLNTMLPSGSSVASMTPINGA